MDGATFEIWIPKREEEEEEVSYYRTVPANGRGSEEPHHQSEVGQEKKHFGINHHFERLGGREGGREGRRDSRKIRQLGNVETTCHASRLLML